MKTKLKYIASLLLGSVVLIGCAPKATRLSADNAPDTQFIECPGLFKSFGDCVNKAKEICPNGYDVLTANHQNTSGATFGTKGETGLLVGEASRSMLVKCK